jgi:2-polyprenyl-3-methyl-5-hydroxy-6-metoxy-1,4-benzoquinol methylase
VLDIGCGEGWLARSLSKQGVRVIGVDVIPALIEQAQKAGGGEFSVSSYEDIAGGKLDVTVDVVVANFSLIGKESVEGLIRRAPSLLAAGGSLVIQTLHPVASCGDESYADGWRKGSWAGFSEEFSDPAPWYFRTMQTWENLLTDSGFRIVDTREPLHPETGKPASVIFIAESA